jgi:hypothetical protein
MNNRFRSLDCDILEGPSEAGVKVATAVSSEAAEIVVRILNRYADFTPLCAAVSAAVNEVERATEKWPLWPDDPIHAFAVVAEEFGECQKEVLQWTYEPHKSRVDDVRTEAIQLAAMSLRFLMSTDRYRTKTCGQHHQ